MYPLIIYVVYLLAWADREGRAEAYSALLRRRAVNVEINLSPSSSTIVRESIF
jgi:hypothetical protein